MENRNRNGKKAELIVSELIINNKSNFSSSLKITLPKL